MYQVELCGRAKLLSARYTFDSSKFETVSGALNEANRLEGAKEDVYYYMAAYYDKFIGKNYKESDLDTQGEIPFYVIRSFGLSLVYGCRNIHQSLPRMISLWLDYGARVASVKEANKKKEMKASRNNTEEVVCIRARNNTAGFRFGWVDYASVVPFSSLSARFYMGKCEAGGIGRAPEQHPNQSQSNQECRENRQSTQTTPKSK